MPTIITQGSLSAKGLWTTASLTGPNFIGRFISPDGPVEFTGVSTDSSGNIYAVGDFRSAYMILAKCNSVGQLQWHKIYIDPGFSQGTSVSVNSQGNNYAYICGRVYAGGSAPGIIISNNTAGTIEWQNQGGPIASDILANSYGIFLANNGVAAFNSSGTLLWKDYPFFVGPANADANIVSVATDSSGNVFAVGYGYQSGTSNYAGVLIKYNSSGVIQWYKWFDLVAGSGGNTTPMKIVLDSSNNIYVGGNVNGGSGTAFPYIYKFDSSGNNVAGVKLIASVDLTLGGMTGLAIDSSNNLYIIGTYTPTSSVVPNAFIVKFNSSLTLQWQRFLTFAPPIYSGSGLTYTNKCAVNGNNLYITGKTNPTGTYNGLLASFPTDGSKTGMYSVGGYACTYSVGTLTTSSTGYTDLSYTQGTSRTVSFSSASTTTEVPTFTSYVRAL